MQFINICVVFFYAAFLRPEVLSEVEAAGIPLSSSSCSLPPIPRHGRYSVSHYDKPIVPGDLVETSTVLAYSCTTEGYQLSPSYKFSLCEGINKWSTLPGCYKTCTLRTSYTLEYSCFSAEGGSVPCLRNMLYGSSVHFTCKAGHVLSGTEILVNMKCGEDGVWSTRLPDCIVDCGRENSDGTRLIVNAPVAKRETVPWNIAVFKKIGDTFDQICGGTILNSRVVISAAHCFYGFGGTEAVELFRVAANKHFRKWGHRDDAAKQTSEVSQIRLPETYRGEELKQASDLALLILTTPFVFSEGVSAICYDLQDDAFDSYQLATHSEGKVAGWGLTENRTPSEELRFLHLPVIDNGVCRVEFAQYNFNNYFTHDKFCGGYKNGTAVCNGDSGAGLVFLDGGFKKQWFLRGVVSTSPRSFSDNDGNCQENTYTAFTRVFRLRDWLLSELKNISLQREDYQGDKCILKGTGALGVCRSVSSCASALNDMIKGLSPQNCMYAGTLQIVCCVPETAEPSPTPAPPTVDTAPTGSSKCPDYPPGAITAEKTGEKAWDYCIDLVSTVYPCTRISFFLNSPLVRRFECAHFSIPLIVGGSPATAGEFPHMALLGFSNDPIQWECSGTLISKDWVMTAAHCIHKRDTGNVTHIRLGGGDINSPLEPEYYYRVAQIVPHPEFIAPSVYNDIALLRTDRSVTFSSMVRPACLHTGNSIDDSKIIATGWGTTSRGVSSLLKVILEKFSHSECSAKDPPSRRSKDGVRDATQLCAGHYSNSGDVCQGDSGGPLQITNDGAVECTYLVMGVTSKRKSCSAPGQPAIFTRVSAFIPWIEDIVWPNGL